MTSTTLGFGDITTQHPVGQVLVIVQVLISLIFLALFFNVFASSLGQPSELNQKDEFGSGREEKPTNSGRHTLK